MRALVDEVTAAHSACLLASCSCASASKGFIGTAGKILALAMLQASTQRSSGISTETESPCSVKVTRVTRRRTQERLAAFQRIGQLCGRIEASPAQCGRCA